MKGDRRCSGTGWTAKPSDCLLLDGLGPEPWVYFVHSTLSPSTRASSSLVATCDYGGPVVAAVAQRRV